MSWLKHIQEELERFKTGRSEFNPYAATNDAAFFAVAAAYFFEKPEQLKEKHPKLF